MTKNKKLNLSFAFDVDANSFELTVTEPETGKSEVANFAYNPEKHKSFNEQIGNDVYEWLELWAREDDVIRNVEPVEEPCETCMVEEPADNAISEEGYQEPFPTY